MDDIVQTAVQAGNFSTLVEAAKTAGLVDTLKSPGPLTVFAPTDAAFKKIPQGELDGLLKDKQKLANVLKHHVVQGHHTSQDIAKKTELPTAEGGEIRYDPSSGRIEGARITQADIEASNGVVHAIDTVLMPE